jgi:hypothetical protein
LTAGCGWLLRADWQPSPRGFGFFPRLFGRLAAGFRQFSGFLERDFGRAPLLFGGLRARPRLLRLGIQAFRRSRLFLAIF